MSLSTVRSNLMDSFNAISCAVYDYAPEAVIPPAAIVFPANPYLEVMTIGSNARVMVNLNVVACVAMNNNQAALNNLEDLVSSMIKALPTGYVVRDVSDFQKTQVGPSDLLTATMVVAVATTL